MLETTRTAPRLGVAHAALALGDFAIGTTEFATMSLLAAFSRDLAVWALALSAPAP